MKNTTKRKVAKWLLVIAGAVLVLSLTGCPDNKELTGTVKIDGIMEVGAEVTANITDSNGTAGKFTYKWKRTPDGGKAIEITGANGATYVIVEADLDHTLGVIIGNADTIGTRTGTAASKVGMADLAHRNFNNKVMFTEGETNYLADIIDARTGARYETLAELGVITQLTNATSAAFDAGELWDKGYFIGVFNGLDGRVKIYIDNFANEQIPGYYASYDVDNRLNLRFNIDYLNSVSDANLQAAFIAAVTEMDTLPTPTVGKVISRGAVRLANVPVPQYNRAMQLRDYRIASRMVRQRLG